MEFFRIHPAQIAPEHLQQQLTIEHLPTYCASVDKVLSSEGDRGEIYCLWGEFRIHRELINGGVRFSLPRCPNGMQWTISAGFPPAPEGVVIHLTINRTEHEDDFIESIEQFLDDWLAGLAGMKHRG